MLAAEGRGQLPPGTGGGGIATGEELVAWWLSG